MLKIKEIKVENPKKIDDTDLADLCNITEQAINAGGGFGWIKVPPREILIKYWKGAVIIPHRKLIIGRLNEVIAGTLQLVFQPQNQEAQQHIANIVSHFVAPWARGFGLAKKMIDITEKKAVEFGSNYIHLDVRETQTAAIKLFQSKGYKKWGTNPYYAYVNGRNLKGHYYYKKIK
tara:strand:- start:959 stop:1486 length:528 start_codon:yes stop_codon:yes gene_type:complete